MKKKEVKLLATEELKPKLLEIRREMIKLRAQASTKTALKNPYQIKKTKKAIARILTELNIRKSKKTKEQESKSNKNKKQNKKENKKESKKA